ncbi:hypothetical protein [Niabella yanshanensis]|uniref:hypothetical protein n=1 Tax=Niabella yanshanensis TaxID=577386 RepID=UPI000E0A8C00|nr:hypothetical protein [Niabella yanshanensis]
MTTSIEIFQSIKHLSRQTFNPCRRLNINDLTETCSVSKDKLLVLLVELENRGLIKINHTKIITVHLTPYGILQDAVTGGLNSEDP